MQILQIVVGSILIVFIFLDFFHTTLSGNGFGWLSGKLNRLLNRILLQNQDRRIFGFSGLTHFLVTTFMWLSILFFGTFLIFTSGDRMVVDAQHHGPTDVVGRFYFTGYLLSTLGVGDLVPGNQTARIFAGVLSFMGFILISAGLTYLLNVVNAVLSKKQLAFFISTIGRDVDEIYKFYKQQDGLSRLISDASDLRQQILKNSSSYLAFPMVNYFLTKDRESALVVQLAILYEVMVVLRTEWEEGTVQHSKITTIIESIRKYLYLGLERPSDELHNEEKLKTLRSFWREYGYVYKGDEQMDKSFSASLHYAGWTWNDVYKLKFQK